MSHSSPVKVRSVVIVKGLPGLRLVVLAFYKTPDGSLSGLMERTIYQLEQFISHFQ